MEEEVPMRRLFNGIFLGGVGEGRTVVSWKLTEHAARGQKRLLRLTSGRFRREGIGCDVKAFTDHQRDVVVRELLHASSRS
jgi:hypothetical protein